MEILELKDSKHKMNNLGGEQNEKLLPPADTQRHKQTNEDTYEAYSRLSTDTSAVYVYIACTCIYIVVHTTSVLMICGLIIKFRMLIVDVSEILCVAYLMPIPFIIPSVFMQGVMMTHRNVLATVSAVMTIVPSIGTKDIYMAYLPLAHILELAAEVRSFKFSYI